MGAVALAEAKKAGAGYADIRINRYRLQFSGYRLSPERGGTKTDEVPFVTDQASFGFGVRVIAGGQWGFAASPLVSGDEIARITREAVVVAKANAVLQASPVQLAPTSRWVDRWTSGFQKDPFGVSVEEKLELTHGAALTAKKDPRIMLAIGFVAFRAEDKYFASSEGSSIQQYIVQVFPMLQATAVDVQKNISRTRRFTTPPSTAGMGRPLPRRTSARTRRAFAKRCWSIWRRRRCRPGRRTWCCCPATCGSLFTNPSDTQRSWIGRWGMKRISRAPVS